MLLVKPSFRILTPLGDDRIKEILQYLELSGRVCYKSEDRIYWNSIEDNSAIPLIKNIIARGHESVLEHESLSVKFIACRGFTHELVRQRLASYCLSGDTRIMRFSGKKDYTIKQLYDIQKNDPRYNKTKLLRIRSINHDNILVPNQIKNVIYSGKQNIYNVTTKLGYSIKSTEDHIFLSKSGETKLKNLKCGDKIFVNGIELFKDKEWLYTQYHINNNSLQNMASIANCSYSSIRKYLRLYKITKVLGAKPKNFSPWNKGINENDDIRVKNQANALRLYHHNGEKGEKSGSWKGGISQRIYVDKKRDIKFCELCGKTDTEFEIHHIDKNRKNNDINNLLKVCIPCHKTIHRNKTKKVFEDTIVSIKPVGIEDTYDIEMYEPYYNFIANGFVVHNSQESTRFCSYKNNVKFIIPPWADIPEGEYKEYIDIPNHTNEDGVSTTNGIFYYSLMLAESAYIALLEQGWKPQEAREILPNALKTEIDMTCNLREWRYVLRLRTQSNCHPQMLELMRPLLATFKRTIPGIFEDITY